jgi:hypothetical protein
VSAALNLDYDEPISAGEFLRASTMRQAELIHHYCGRIDERIRMANSREAAAEIAEEACRTFKTECPSEILRAALTGHVREVLEKHWA